MKLLLLIFFTVMISCQSIYLKSSQGRLKDPYIYNDIIGSWKNNGANIYITFNPFDEYIVSEYIKTKYSYGHVIKSTGFYEIIADTLILIDERSGIAEYYISHFFDDHTWLEPENSLSSRYFYGAWLPVPLIVEFGLRDLHIHRQPIVKPPPLAPVVIEPSPSHAPADNHKKRPDRPKIKRPKKPDLQKQNKKKPKKKRPVRVIT